MIGCNLLINTQLAGNGQATYQNFELTQEGDIASTPTLQISVDRPYASYPLQFFTINGIEIVLEGMVYNRTPAQLKQTFLQHSLPQKMDWLALQKATVEWSGEWVCWLKQQQNLIILNDVIGRLDVYLMQTPQKTFIGRSLHWLSQRQPLQFDKWGVASFLWTCSCVGYTTLYQNVKRMAGNSILQINLATGHATYTKASPLNFDARVHNPIKTDAQTLTHLFKQATANIVNHWQAAAINISLSGGQDSRAVAVAFAQAKHPNLFATSYLDAASIKDVAGAAAIAAMLHIPYKAYPIVPKKELELELLQKKMGMNYLGMSFILDYNHQLIKDYPNRFLYVTGDGGDKAIPYLGERNKQMGMDELVTKILYRNSTISPAQVCQLTGTDLNDFKQFVYQLLAGYPEKNNNNKSIHFTIYERALTQMMQGEDRSRYYFWSATPFYDIDFFKTAMMVQDKHKQGIKLYRHIQNLLSKEVANIPDSGVGFSINSLPFQIKKMGYEWFRSTPPSIKKMVRKIGGISIKPNAASPAQQAALMQQFTLFPQLQSVLDMQKVETFLPQTNKEQYSYLQTLIALQQILKP